MWRRRLLLQLLFLAGQQRVDGRIELVAALEEVQLQDEDVACDLAAEFLDERACCGCRASCDRMLASVPYSKVFASKAVTTYP